MKEASPASERIAGLNLPAPAPPYNGSPQGLSSPSPSPADIATQHSLPSESPDHTPTIDDGLLVREGRLIPRILLEAQSEHNATALSRIGRYTLLGELGRGGMGVVYRAWDPKLDRTVALKMLLWGGMAGDVRRKRFVREAQAIARLEHPAIVRIYDTGEHRGCPFYTMDYVAGITLQQRIEQEGSLSPTDALRIIAITARALQHAHDRGIVHRDIKPANILLEDGRNPRLSDFGIAQLGEGDSDLTQTGQVVGTPAYMAPEQALGLPGTIGPQADVYALGAVLYHLLTGRLPFDSASHLQPALRSTLEAPSPRLIRESLPWDATLICRKAMAPAPADRYASALALAEDAERFLRGEPVQASAPTLVRRVQWHLYRSRAVLTGGLVAVLVLLLMAGIWRTYQVREAEALQQAREQVALDRLTALKAQFPARHETDTLTRAEEALDAFAELSEVQQTRAHAQGLLYVGQLEQAAGELSAALDHDARAWLVARHPEEQVGALLAMSSIFEALGDWNRFQALQPILQRFQPTEASAAGFERFERLSALSERNIPRLLQRLTGTTAQDFLPFLRQLGQLKRSGIKSEVLLYSAEGHVMSWYGLSRQDTTLPILDPAAKQGAGLPLRLVNAPPGQYLDGPVIELGLKNRPRRFFLSTRRLSDDGTERTISRLEGSGFVPEIRLEPASIYGAVTVDLNGDGEAETYVSANRRLMTLTLPPGGTFELKDAHPETSRSNSEIMRLLAMDLDGDQKPELVALCTGWRAYDVRVFKPGPTPGTLELVALRRIGSVWDAAPFTLADGTPGLAVSTVASEPNLRAFPEASPTGMPPGIYVLKLQNRRLDLAEYIAPPFAAASIGRLLSGDFDGDGRPDLAAQVQHSLTQSDMLGQIDSYLQLISRRPDGRLAQLSLPGLLPWQALNMDADPATELLALDHPSGELVALGVAGEPLLPLQHPRSERPALAGAPRPDAAASLSQNSAWERIDLLASLGLTHAGVRELMALATSAPDIDAAAQRLSLAATLLTQSGKESEAEALLLTILKRAPSSFPALSGLADLYRLNWRHEDERRILSRALASPERREADVPALKARLDWLKQLARRRTDAVQIGGGLDPRWHLDTPFQVSEDLQRGALVVSTYALQGDILHAPFRWDGGRLSLHIKATIRRAEWGAGLRIGIRPEGGGPEDVMVAAQLGSGGGGDQLQTHADLYLKGKNFGSAWKKLSRDADTPFELDIRLEIAPETGEAFLNVNGGRRIDTLLKLPQFGGGPFELAITGAPDGSPAYGMLEVGIESLSIQGGQLLPATVEPTQQAWRTLLAGEYAEAQRLANALRPVNPVDSEHIQYLAQCRSGAQTACLASLTRLLRAGGPGVSQLNHILRDQLHTAPAQIYPTLQSVLGYQALARLAEAWANAPHAHAANAAVLLATTTAPSEEDLRRLPPPRTLREKLALLDVMAVRAQSLLLLKQYDAAITFSGTVQRYAELLLPTLSDADARARVQDYLSLLERTLARAYARTGLPVPCLRHVRRALELSPVPRVFAEELAVLPEFAPLLKLPEFKALLHPTAYTLPELPAVRGL